MNITRNFIVIVCAVVIVLGLVIFLFVRRKMKKPATKIYELDLSTNLSEPWDVIWELFESTCDLPEQPLSLENQKVFQECKEIPDKNKWDKFEMDNKKLPPTGPTAKNQWIQNHYKFRRDSTKTMQGIGASFMSILGEFPSYRGNFYYPSGGCREWHTNRNDGEGWRIYLSKNDPPESGIFHVYDEKTKKVNSYPDKARMIRMFYIDTKNPLWHSITSNGNRWSMGFSISNEAAEKLKKIMK